MTEQIVHLLARLEDSTEAEVIDATARPRHGDRKALAKEQAKKIATTALQNGVDVKTVSSMLGHFDAGFTLRTYTHATRQKQDEAATAMGSFMEQVR